MKKRKWPALLLVLTMLLSILPIRSGVMAAMEGDGSLTNPYQVKTAADLENLADSTAGKYYKLMNDITIDKNFKTIKSFKGFLDGNGHTISGLNVEYKWSGTDKDNIPKGMLFGTIEESAVVRDIVFSEPKFTTVEVKNDGYVKYLQQGMIAEENKGIIDSISMTNMQLNLGYSSTNCVVLNDFGGVVYWNYGKIMNVSQSGDIYVSSSSNIAAVAVKNYGVIANVNNKVNFHIGGKSAYPNPKVDFCSGCVCTNGDTGVLYNIWTQADQLFDKKNTASDSIKTYQRSYAYICTDNYGTIQKAYYVATAPSTDAFVKNDEWVDDWGTGFNAVLSQGQDAPPVNVAEAGSNTATTFQTNQESNSLGIVGLVSGTTPIYNNSTRAKKGLLVMKNHDGSQMKAEAFYDSHSVSLPQYDANEYYCTQWGVIGSTTCYAAGTSQTVSGNIELSPCTIEQPWYPYFVSHKDIAAGDTPLYKVPETYSCVWRKVGETGTVTAPTAEDLEAAGVQFLLQDPSNYRNTTSYRYLLDDDWKTADEWYEAGKMPRPGTCLIYRIVIPDSALPKFKPGTYDMYSGLWQDRESEYVQIQFPSYEIEKRKLTTENINTFIDFQIATNDTYHENYEGNYTGVTWTAKDGCTDELDSNRCKIFFKKQGTNTKVENPQESGTYEVWADVKDSWVYTADNNGQVNSGKTYTIAPQEPTLSLATDPTTTTWASDLKFTFGATVEKNRATESSKAVTGFPESGIFILNIIDADTDTVLANHSTANASENKTYTWPKASIPNAGTNLKYTLQYKDNSGNYATKIITQTATVGKATPVISAAATDATYGGDVVITVTADGNDVITSAGDCTLSVTGDPSATFTSLGKTTDGKGWKYSYTPSKVGSHTVSVTYNESTNYNTAATNTNFTVTAKALTASVTTADGGYAYGDSMKARLTIEGKPKNGAADAATSFKVGFYSSPSSNLPVTTKSYSGITAATTDKEIDLPSDFSAGTYYMRLETATLENGNYTMKPGLELGSYTINRRDPLASDFVYTAPTNLTYNGMPKTAKVAVKTQTWEPCIGTVTVKYARTTGESADVAVERATVEAPTDCGHYYVYASNTNGDSVNNGTTYVGEFFIEKKAPEASEVAVSVNGSAVESAYTYNGSPFTATAVASTPDTFDVSAVKYKNADDDTITATAPIAPGTYRVLIDATESKNYTQIENLDTGVDIVIQKAAAAITISNDSYYSYDEGATITGKVDKCNGAAVLPTGTITAKLYADSTEKATLDSSEIVYSAETGEFTLAIPYSKWEVITEHYKVQVSYSGDDYYNAQTVDSDQFLVGESAVTFTVSNKEHQYAPGTSQNITVTPDVQHLPENGIVIQYYKTDENAGTFNTTPVTKAVTAGRYLYVISLSTEAEKNYRLSNAYTVSTDDTIPNVSAYENIGFMDILAGSQAAQKPIFFADPIINTTMTGTVENPLINPNGTTATYSSSDKTVAEVNPTTGAITIMGAGSTVIVATSSKSGATDVYASYTLNVNKEVVTVTVDSPSVAYGTDRTAVANSYTLSKPDAASSISGTPVYTTAYDKGSSCGQYSVTMTGLTSKLYELVIVPGTLSVTPKELTLSDLNITAESRAYDKTNKAVINATVTSGIVEGDLVTVLAEGTFESENVNMTEGADLVQTVSYRVTGLSGTHSGNYRLSGTMTGTTTARIMPAEVTVSVPATTTYIYDSEPKSVNVVAYANGLYFEDYQVTYNGSTTAPSAASETPYEVGVSITNPNYALSGSVSANLVIRSAQQEFFSIEGIADTVTYGDDPFDLQADGVATDANVTYSVVDGNAVSIKENTVTVQGVGKVTIQAESTMANHETKTAKRTFTVKKKTLNVTAKPQTESRVYDGNKNYEVTLIPDGVVTGDTVTLNYMSATSASADVENNKTIFVNGITLSGKDANKYQLSATSAQTAINVTKRPITAIAIKAVSKQYDGKTTANYTIANTGLTGVIKADRDFVTVVGSAAFDTATAGENKTVTLTDYVLNGTKSGNYELLIQDKVTAKANITKANVDFTLGTTEYVYDGAKKNVSVTASVNGAVFTKYKVKYQKGGTEKDAVEAGDYDIVIELTDETNYQTAYKPQKLKIVKASQSAISITGLVGTVEYGAIFPLQVIGGDGDGAVTWESSAPEIATVNKAGVVTICGTGSSVTITATKAGDENFDNNQTATVEFTPVKKAIGFRVSNLTYDYDGHAKSLTIDPSAGSDNYSVTYTDETGAPVATPTNAGTYYAEIHATGHYSGTQSATLTIRQVEAMGSIAMEAEKYTYGGMTPKAIVSGLQDGTTAEITYAGTGIYAATTTAPINAGSYTAIATISGANYKTKTITVDFEIQKAILTVKAKDATRFYGDPNPEFELVYTGFQNGDDKTALLYEPIASVEATVSSGIGTYPITVSGGRAENYELVPNTTNKGILTIEKQTNGTMAITGSNSTVYVNEPFTLHLFYNNSKIDAIWSSSVSEVATIDPSTGVGVAKKAGTTIITATAGDEFNKESTTFTLTVKQSTITLVPMDLVKTYTGIPQEITFAPNAEFTPILSGDDKNMEVTYTPINGSSAPSTDGGLDVGVYSVVYRILDDNYAGGGTATMYINQANVALKVAKGNKEYGEVYTAYDLEFTNEGTLAEEAKAAVLKTIKPYVTYASEGAAATAAVNEVGYEITPTLLQTETPNVKFTVEKGTLIVTKAPLIISVNPVTREYGAENPALEVTYTGFKNKETKDVLNGELELTYDESINAETPVDVYPNETYPNSKTHATGLTADNYDIRFVDGGVTITKIAVKASAGAARKTYLTVRLDKAIEGLTDANFIVTQEGKGVVLSSVEVSNKNMTYTLNGNFEIGKEYVIQVDLTETKSDATHEIVSEALTVKPTNAVNGGGGGGGSTMISYTVSFETNGGSKIDSVKVAKNKTVAEPTAPEKEGYVFEGWYSDKALTKKYDFSTKVTKTMTLYANWTEEEPEEPIQPTEPIKPEWKNPFTDVAENAWYFNNVKYVNENGMMSGVSETEFAPNESLTRGMIVTVLYRAEGSPAVNKSKPFVDVSADSYYASAVNWAQQNGIVYGVSETEFAPEETVTREQIATMMFRYATYKGVAPTGAWAIRLNYVDLADISDYAMEGVMCCTLQQIMLGKEGNRFAPKENATRAEIAAILQRFMEANQ